MVTPAGKECRFYYENFHRGHSDQECRLVLSNPNSEEWRPTDCQNCPVPDILLANSNPDLVLEGRITKGFLGFNRKINIKAFCSKHLIDVPDPFVGCSVCASERPGFEELFGGKK